MWPMTAPPSIRIVPHSAESDDSSSHPLAANQLIGGVLGTISIHVAAYDTLLEALDDWNIGHLAGANHHNFIDAVLVETDCETICAIHRFSSDGVARGSIAASMAGLLRPPALICGALAGGVGEQTITSLSAALDRDDIKHLGKVIDQTRFTIIIVAATAIARPSDNGTIDSGAKATASHTVTTSMTSESVRRAARTDDQRAP
jgi:hypothetical protein